MRKVKLRAEGITHMYKGEGGREIKALEDVTLDIYENEFVTIIGPSGCGKTTFLNILAGFIKPAQGKVFCEGKEVTGPAPDRGFVFQEDAVFPWMSVRDNIEFGLIARGIPKEERRRISNKFIKLVGLTGFENAWPKELSGGMLKRVDIARTYAVDPTIMLMDEPFGPLDAQTRSIMQEELARIWFEARKTVIFVTHDVDEAIFLADRIVIFTPRPGRIKSILEVDLPRPRVKKIILSKEFLKLKEKALLELGFI
jgi:NitT/TauT family transport system ATP-binding protein